MTLRQDAIAATMQATAPWAPIHAEAYASLDGLLDWMDDHAHELGTEIYSSNRMLPFGWDYVSQLVDTLRKDTA